MGFGIGTERARGLAIAGEEAKGAAFGSEIFYRKDIAVTITLPHNQIRLLGDAVNWSAPSGSNIDLGVELSSDEATNLWLQRFILPRRSNRYDAEIFLVPLRTSTFDRAQGPEFSSDFETRGTIRLVAQ